MKVTIVIPCYNNATWVSQAVDSALNQVGISPVVWVIDDHSTDDSWAKITAYGDKIHALRQPENRGGNAARQLGLQQVETEWVQFLDADDELLPNKISTQIALAEETTDLIYGPVIERIESSSSGTSYEYTHQLKPPHDPSVHWFRWQFAQTASALWRTESIKSVGGWNPDQLCCQDNELCLRALQKELTALPCHQPGVLYRVWSTDTVSRRDPLRIITERTRLMDSYLDTLQSTNSLEKPHQQAASQGFFEMARAFYIIDPENACCYARERISKGYFSPQGPAASPLYRVLFSLCGFRFSERLASLKRGIPKASERGGA